MRKSERLDYTYDEICRLHKKYIPDWRFNQTIINFLYWHMKKFGNDGFYNEDDKIIERFKEFLKDSVGAERFED
jgi:hypothetical protein